MSRRAILRLTVGLCLVLAGPALARADSSGTRTSNGKSIKYKVVGNRSRGSLNRVSGGTEFVANSGGNEHKVLIEPAAITLKDKKKAVPAWKTIEINVSGADIQIKADDKQVFPD